MTDRELQELLDARPPPEAAARAVEGLPPERRREAKAMVVLARISAAQPRPPLPADFTHRTMARVRARPAPRRTLVSWFLAPRVSPLAAAAGVAAAILLTFAGLEVHARLTAAPAEAVAVAAPATDAAPSPAEAVATAAPAPDATPSPATTPAALSAAPAERVIRLRIEAPGARTVQLAGDFNRWRPESTPLRRTGATTWSVDVPLAAGRRYQYMFVVDGQWVTDPAAPAHVDDGFGNRNAILDI